MEEKKVSLVNRIINYIKETLAESKKVSWPDKKYVWTATLIIIVLVLVLGLSITVIDYGLSQAITTLTRAR